MSQAIQLRQDGEPSDNYTQYESPNTGDRQAVCASYIANAIAEQLGSFAELTVSDSAEVEATLAKTTSNYAVFETPGEAVTGLYVSRDALAEALDTEFEDEGDIPETVGLSFAPSDSDAFEEVAEEAGVDEEEDGVDEEEVEALVAGGGTDEPDESDEEEVEISDEEVGLVDGE